MLDNSGIVSHSLQQQRAEKLMTATDSYSPVVLFWKLKTSKDIWQVQFTKKKMYVYSNDTCTCTHALSQNKWDTYKKITHLWWNQLPLFTTRGSTSNISVLVQLVLLFKKTTKKTIWLHNYVTICFVPRRAR